MFFRKVLTASVVAFWLSAPAIAGEAAPVAPAAAAPASLTTADTSIGSLLDIPAAKAILEKHAPHFAANSQIEMTRGMTLRQVQSYASDMLTDEVLAKIDADLAKLPRK